MIWGQSTNDFDFYNTAHYKIDEMNESKKCSFPTTSLRGNLMQRTDTGIDSNADTSNTMRKTEPKFK